MAFKYVAYAANNSIVEGNIDATSESAAEEALLRAGYRPLVLRPLSRKFTIETAFPSLFTPKLRDVVAFASQTSALLRAGIPLVTALETMREQFTNNAMRATLTTIIQDVRGGRPLSQAIAAFPRVFPALYIRMVAAGERAGDLEGMLRQMADYYGKEIALKKKIQGAMFYPMIVVVMTLAVSVMMVTFVLPKVTLLSTTLKVPLPLITRLMLGGSNALVVYKFYVAGGIVAAVVGMRSMLKRPAVHAKVHRLMLSAPVIGKILVYRELGRLARTMGLLLGSALPIPDILEMSGQLVENDAVRAVVREVRQEVMVGHPLAGPLIKSSFVPPTFSQMVRTGEMTGGLDTNLRTLADMYETELADLLQTAVSMIEPIMTITIGIMVGAMAISVVLPIYTVVGSMGSK